MLAIFWLASKHTSNVCTTNQPTCPRPATLSQEKAKENKRILKLNYCFRTHTHMQLAQWPHPQPLGNTQGRSRSRRPVNPQEEVEKKRCHATHTKHIRPSDKFLWQHDRGNLWVFADKCRARKISPIRLSLLRNTPRCCLVSVAFVPYLWMDATTALTFHVDQNSSGCCMQISHCDPSAVKASASAPALGSLACSSTGAWPSACWHG